MRLKLLILSLLIGTINQNLQAQKQAWKWFFERNNGLDFSGDTVRYA